MGKLSGIRVVLSSACMGGVEEVDFDAWAGFVAENIDEAVGFPVAEVDQLRFGDAGEDRVLGATPEQRAVILRWLGVEGWEAFCGAEWDRRRERLARSRWAA